MQGFTSTHKAPLNAQKQESPIKLIKSPIFADDIYLVRRLELRRGVGGGSRVLRVSLVGKDVLDQICMPLVSAKMTQMRLGGRQACRLTPVCNLAGGGVDVLEQLVHLLFRHLLAQFHEDVFHLADTNKAGAILVEDFEASAVLVDVAGIAETAGAVEDLGESVEIDCRRRSGLARRTSQSWVVAESASGRCPGMPCSGRLTVTTSLLLEVPDLGHGRVLAAGAEEVAELVERNAAIAALVEELEGFPVVGRGLRL